jgi:O-antigen/teichoic acid export membrane protein
MVFENLGGWMISAAPAPLRLLWARVNSSHIGGRLARGTFWAITGAVLSRALGLAVSIVLARLLGMTGFGELGVIQSTAGLFGTFAGFGIGVTATKYVAELRGSALEQCGRVIGFSLATAIVGGLVTGLGLVLAADWLAVHTLAAPQLAPLLRVGAGLVVFGALQGAYLGALSGFEAFKQVAWVNWTGSLAGMPAVLIGAMIAGLEGAVWGMVLQTAIGCALGHWALAAETRRAGVRILWTVNREGWLVLWRFTLPAFLSTMLATPAGWLSRTMLLNMHGGYAEMALVNAANQWMTLVSFLPWMMGSVLVPIFASLHVAGRRAELRQFLRYNLLLNAVVTLALGLPLVLFARRILMWYGPSFTEGVMIFDLTMLACLFLALNNLLSRTMQATGRPWWDLISNGLWAAVVLLLSWWLVPRHRGDGLVAAHALAAVALLAWQFVLVHFLLRRSDAARPCQEPRE